MSLALPGIAPMKPDTAAERVRAVGVGEERCSFSFS